MHTYIKATTNFFLKLKSQKKTKNLNLRIIKYKNVFTSSATENFLKYGM